MSNADMEQKLKLIQLFWSWEYFTHLEVKLVHPQGSSNQSYELTDVDVFALRTSSDLSMERIIGDCKTLKSVSPINRAFWLKGVMEYFGAARGYLLLNPKKPITEDHKLGARSMGITLLSEEDFEILFSRLLRQNVPARMKLFREDSWTYLEQGISNIGFAKRINDYRKYQYWLDSPARSLRYCLFEPMSINEKIDPRQKFQRALILDMVTLFSISFMSMVSHLFHIHLIPEKKADMDEYLKAYVYGGRETYNQVNRLHRAVQDMGNYYSGKQSVDDSIRDLSLPEWEHFLHLFRTVLDNPAQFTDVPRLLRFVLFERLLYENNEVALVEALPSTSTHAIKFAIDVADYFLKASKLDELFWDDISNLLLASLVEVQGNGSDTDAKLVRNTEE